MFFYEINFVRCENSTNNNFSCKSNYDINKRLNSFFLLLKFVDNLIDITNFENPIQKLINNKKGFIKGNSIITSNINFNSFHLFLEMASFLKIKMK